jgi:hypothetical protein
LFRHRGSGGREQTIEAAGESVSVVVDDTWPVGSEPAAVWQIDAVDFVDGDMRMEPLPVECATRFAGNAAELGRQLSDEWQARRIWDDANLRKGRQPLETLRRDTYLYYLVKWRGLKQVDAGIKAPYFDEDVGLRPRAGRGNSTARAAQPLSPRTVRKAVKRITELLAI